MGCSSSVSKVAEATKSKNALSEKIAERKNAEENKSTVKAQYPASEAFIISLNNEKATDIPMETINKYMPVVEPTPLAKKKPPKRIQELIELGENTEQTLTLEELQEKQQLAQLRRKEFMQSRLHAIQKTTQMSLNLEEEDDDAVVLDGTAIRNPNKIFENMKSNSDPNYAKEIESKALADDQKQELLTTVAVQHS